MLKLELLLSDLLGQRSRHDYRMLPESCECVPVYVCVKESGHDEGVGLGTLLWRQQLGIFNLTNVLNILWTPTQPYLIQYECYVGFAFMYLLLEKYVRGTVIIYRCGGR